MSVAAAVAATRSWTLTPSHAGGLAVRGADIGDAGRAFGPEDSGQADGRHCTAFWHGAITVSAVLPAGSLFCTHIQTLTLEDRGCPAFLGCPAMGRR